MPSNHDNESGSHFNRSGSNIDGHEIKWNEKNRRKDSFNSGAGRKGARNQGTGLAGKANTIASDAVDTSRMNPEEKLKYFNSLGLMPGAKPTPEPSIKELPNVLRKIFADEPTYIKDITQALRAVSSDKFQPAVQAVFDTTNNSTEHDDVYDVYSNIMQAIQSI